MALTHALPTNNYGESHLIVATSAAEGTHTTLASAMADARVGDTIFLRDSVTENVTITPGVNIAAFTSNALNTPTITGKLTMTGAGTSTISGIHLKTNSDFFLAVTGSAASIINLNNCYLNCTNNTGISFTSSSSSAIIYANNCTGNLGTTGIGYHSSSSAGTLRYEYCNLFNSGASTTPSSNSAGSVLFKFSRTTGAFSTSSTGSMEIDQSFVNTSTINTISLTTAGTGSVTSNNSLFSAGTASAISVGVNTTVLIANSTISSSSVDTNAIIGSGTVGYSGLVFGGTANTITTTTQTALLTRFGYQRSTKQPAFLGYLPSSDLNVTGDGTNFTLGGVTALTEVFDQNGDFNTNGTFTAPFTGRYYLAAGIRVGGITTGMTNSGYNIVCSNRNFLLNVVNPGVVMSATAVYSITGSALCDMDAGDTATFVISLNNGTKVADAIGDATNALSFFSGNLVC